MSLVVYKKVCRKIRNKFIKILVQLEINFIRSLPNLDSVVVFCVSVAKMSLHAVVANKAIVGNRPFYNCVLGDLAFEWGPGWG